MRMRRRRRYGWKDGGLRNEKIEEMILEKFKEKIIIKISHKEGEEDKGFWKILDLDK